MVADAGDVPDGVVNGSGTGGSCQRSSAVFQCSDSLLKDIGGGVHQTGVDVARFGQTETACCLCRVCKDIGGGGINRNGSCVSDRIRLFLTHVELLGFKVVIFSSMKKQSFLYVMLRESKIPRSCSL